MRKYSVKTFATLLLFGFCLAAAQLAQAQSVEREALASLRRQLEADPAAFDRSKLRHLERTARSRHVGEAKVVAALEVLALHDLLSGNANSAMQHLAVYADYETGNLSDIRLPCFLLHARALAADGKLREALKRVDYAAKNTDGCAHALALTMHATLAMDTRNFAEAFKSYSEALAYGDKFFRPKRVSDTVKPEAVPGTPDWKRLRPELVEARDEAEQRRDVEMYGDGFCNWRDARKRHLSGKFEKAQTAYAKLAREFPDTVYAEGARFHAAECLLELGEVRRAAEEFAEFAKSDPLGLWRGEALFNLANIHLRHRFDTDDAREAFENVVDWVNTVRERDRDIELFMVPEKAKKIVAPASTPLKQVRGELVPADIEPRMVINRRTTDWYLDRLQWDAFYSLGFLAAVDDDWDTAKHLWTRAFNMNEQLQKQYAEQIGSLHLRLMCAVRGRCFVARPYELEAYKGRRNRERRIKLMLADLDALRLKWDSAEKLYRGLIDDRSTTDEQKAVALRCLGTAMFFQERRDESRKIMEELVEKYSKYPSSYKALVRLAKINQKDMGTSMQLLKQAEKVAPNDDEAAFALMLAGTILQYTHIRYDEARKTWREVIQKYPESQWAEMSEKRIVNSHEREERRKGGK